MFHDSHMEAKTNQTILEIRKGSRALHNWKRHRTERENDVFWCFLWFSDGIQRLFKIMTTLKPKPRASSSMIGPKLHRCFPTLLKNKLEARTSSCMPYAFIYHYVQFIYFLFTCHDLHSSIVVQIPTSNLPVVSGICQFECHPRLHLSTIEESEDWQIGRQKNESFWAYGKPGAGQTKPKVITLGLWMLGTSQRDTLVNKRDLIIVDLTFPGFTGLQYFNNHES